MKNIKKYNEFRNINNKLITEAIESATGYVSPHGDPFINVPGNFAGAENTLVGSAVSKIFNFVKRKGYQLLMKTWLKPALELAYKKGLLKYVIISKKMLPKAKVHYKIHLIKNENEESVDKSDDLIVKFVLDGNYDFDVNSVITTQKEEKIANGFYKINDYDNTFKSVDSIVTEIRPEETKDEIYDSIDETETETDSDKNKNLLSTDIKELSDMIILEINKSDITKEKLQAYLTNVNSMLKITQEGLVTINTNLKAKDLTVDKKLVLETDKITFEEDIQEINRIKLVIKEKLQKISREVKPTAKPTAEAKPVAKSVAVKQEGIEYNIYDEMLLEEVEIDETEVATTEAPVKYTKEDIEKLTNLSKSGIDLNDKEFNNLFNDDNTKQEATKTALDYKSDIIRIQLSAERFIMNNKGEIDRKLQNNWMKMVQRTKQKFAHYFEIDQLDPKMLRDKLGTDVNKIEKNVGGGSRSNSGNLLTKTDDVKMAISFDENEITKDKILIKKYNEVNVSNLSIITLNGYHKKQTFVCCIEMVDNYYIYRLVGTIENYKNLDKVKSVDELKTFISKDVKLMKSWFVPPMDKYGKLNSGEKFMTTFLLGRTKAPTIGKTQQVIPIYVYSKSDDLNINKNSVFFRHNVLSSSDITKDNIAQVKANETVSSTQQDSINFSSPFLINPKYYGEFGLSDKDTRFSFANALIGDYKNAISNYLARTIKKIK